MRCCASLATASVAVCGVRAFHCLYPSSSRSPSAVTSPRQVISCSWEHGPFAETCAAITATSTAKLSPSADRVVAGSMRCLVHRSKRYDRRSPHWSSSVSSRRRRDGRPGALPDGTLESDTDISNAQSINAAGKDIAGEIEDGGGKGLEGRESGRRMRDGRHLSKLSKRLNDLFPLVTAEEMRMLLNPDEQKVGKS